MATADAVASTHDRHVRRRPFAWMRRLANLKGSSSESQFGKKSHGNGSAKKKQENRIKNNPYPESGFQRPITTDSERPSFVSSPMSRGGASFVSSEPGGDLPAPTKSLKSTAPTVATNPETVHSEGGHSKSHTNCGGANSTFSSPNHSDRSLTTTLTTIQSTAPSALLGQQGTHPGSAAGSTNAPLASTPTVHFSHQFPTSPATAIPQHLSSQTNQPQTYNAATANNMLTDNASILTLASSSKRRRRHSLDTDASVRALAPSSVWGGSRESLPLSVLSANIDTTTPISAAPTASGAGRPSIGLASAERASVYSSSGVAAPALSSDRNSLYAGKSGTMDGASSVRSGLLGHGRTESITGSIGGITTGGAASTGSPLASPREPPSLSKFGRRSSDWGRREDGESDVEEDDHPSRAGKET